MSGKINIRLTILFVILMGLSVVSMSYGESIKLQIRAILESSITIGSLWCLTIVSLGMHYFVFGRKSKDGGGLLFSHFGPFFDTCTAIVTYCLVFSSSITLLKGICIQHMFGDMIYFFEFDNIDVASISIVSLFLLGFSLFNILKTVFSVVINSNAEELTPLPDVDKKCTTT